VTRGTDAPPPSLWELARVYLRISLLGFGGPNAHLALMLDEVVERRRWLSRERFLELMAVTNLLPGPNSSEVAIHVGYTQRGWRGALVTGLTFLLPTFVIVTALSALYFRYGTLPRVELLFWGLQPVIVAVVISAGLKIGRAGVRTGTQAALAVLGGVVSFGSGRSIIGAMALAGLLTWWMGRERGGDRPGPPPGGGRGTPPGGRATRPRGDAGEARPHDPDPQPDDPDPQPHDPDPRRHDSDPPRPDRGGVPALVLLPLALGGGTLGLLGSVFWTHLWIGSVLFGGGYVLVALLEPYAVGELGWLTAAQFLDGVALTQAVPGPISTLSAFVGYAAAGVPGAILGTAGIYLPAFAGVLLAAPRLERLRETAGVQDALEGVVAVAAGAVLGVGASLVVEGVRDPAAALLAGAALLLGVWKQVPALWLVGGGLAAGLVRVAMG